MTSSQELFHGYHEDLAFAYFEYKDLRSLETQTTPIWIKNAYQINWPDVICGSYWLSKESLSQTMDTAVRDGEIGRLGACCLHK